MIRQNMIGITLRGDSADFDRTMTSVKKNLMILERDIKSVGRTLSRSIGGITKWGSAIAAASGIAVAAITKSSLESIKELRNLSNVAGLSVAEFERMAFAAKSYGIEQDKLADIVKDSADKFGDFFQNNAGPLKDFFTNIAPQVGITADAFRNLNARDALQLYVSSLEKANLNQKDMTFYMEAIASDATMLLPLLRNNGKAMSDMEKAARDLGIGLSEVDVQNAIKAQEKLDQIGSVIDSVINEAVVKLAPYIETAVTEVLKFITASGGIDVLVRKGFEKAGEAVQGVIKYVKDLKKSFDDMLDSVKPVTDGISSGFKRVTDFLADQWESATKLAENNTDRLGKGMNKFVELYGEDIKTIGNNLKVFGNVLPGINLNLNKQADAAKEVKKEQVEAATETKESWLDSFNAYLAAVDKVIEKNKALGESNKDVKPEQTESVYIPADAYGDFGESFVAGIPEIDEEKYRSQLELMREIDQEHWKTTEMGNLEHLLEMENQLKTALGNDADARKQYADLALDIENAKQDALKSMAIDTFETVLAFAAQNSKKAFKLQQAYGIAETIISTAKAIMKAYDILGPIGGTIAAIKIAAVGAMKIQQIKAARPGGGGGGGGGIGAVSGGGQANQQAPEQAPQGPNRIFNVDLTGSSTISSQQARNLLEVINEQAGDGVEINIRGASGG